MTEPPSAGPEALVRTLEMRVLLVALKRLAGVLEALAGSLGWLLGSRASMSALGMMNLIAFEHVVIVHDGCFSEAILIDGLGRVGVT